MNSKKISNIFETESITKILVLCVLTFGLFVIFKLYKFSKKLNSNVASPISNWFMNTAVVIHLVSFISLLIFFGTNGSQELLIFSKSMHIVSSIFHLVWIIKVRNRINEVNQVFKGDSLWLNPFLSSFFHVIYMQYKINKTILIEGGAETV